MHEEQQKEGGRSLPWPVWLGLWGLIAAGLLFLVPWLAPHVSYAWSAAGFRALLTALKLDPSWAVVLGFDAALFYALALPAAAVWLMFGRWRLLGLLPALLLLAAPPILQARFNPPHRPAGAHVSTEAAARPVGWAQALGYVLAEVERQIFGAGVRLGAQAAREFYVERPDGQVVLSDQPGTDAVSGLSRKLVPPEMAAQLAALRGGPPPRPVEGDFRAALEAVAGQARTGLSYAIGDDGKLRLYEGEGIDSETGAVLRTLTPAVAAKLETQPPPKVATVLIAVVPRSPGEPRSVQAAQALAAGLIAALQTRGVVAAEGLPSPGQALPEGTRQGLRAVVEAGCGRSALGGLTNCTISAGLQAVRRDGGASAMLSASAAGAGTTGHDALLRASEALILRQDPLPEAAWQVPLGGVVKLSGGRVVPADGATELAALMVENVAPAPVKLAVRRDSVALGDCRPDGLQATGLPLAASSAATLDTLAPGEKRQVALRLEGCAGAAGDLALDLLVGGKPGVTTVPALAAQP